MYTLKDWRTRPGHGDYVEGIGVQDVERGGLAAIKPAPWQTDTSIGDWFYNRNWQAKDTGTMYRSAKWIVHTLIDVVSKNGNLLLNVIQRPDGSLDPEVETLLADLAAWMKINGEAIHATRPWVIYGEGRTKTEAGHFKEDFAFSAADIRFTQAKDGRTVYAIALGWPEGRLTLNALRPARAAPKATVRLLGHPAPLRHRVNTAGALEIDLPAEAPCGHACAFKLTGFDFLPPPAEK